MNESSNRELTSGSWETPRGLFMWSLKVLRRVLLDCCIDLQRSSQLVPHGPIATHIKFPFSVSVASLTVGVRCLKDLH